MPQLAGIAASYAECIAMRLVAAALVLLVAACRAAPVPAETELSGGVLYASNGCGACHGQAGKGDGPLAKTLKPPPRDFRDAESFKNGRDVASIAQTIATGLTRDGGQMQSYKFLSPDERERLAQFVISLRDDRDTRSQP